MSIEVKVPDIGDFKNVPVIEVLVKPGDAVKADDPILVLESDKATMEVPAPSGGVVKSVAIKTGDKVSEGTVILTLEGEGGAAAKPAPAAAPAAPSAPAASKDAGGMKTPAAEEADAMKAKTPSPVAGMPVADFSGVHASPSVRRFAREFDIDLTKVKGTGDKGRITREDVKAHLAGSGGGAAGGAVSGGMGIPEVPAVDFSKFGPIEEKPMGRIKKISGPHLHRSWLNVPHVTHNDEADITETEAFRKSLDDEAKNDKKNPYRVSLLPFLMKASVAALKKFPDFNSSLNPAKDGLIYKKFYNIGIAVDTPDGLVVPVVKNVDSKGIGEISQELAAISAKARDGKLSSGDMQGATFTISSLGGIGGTAFTPIVNAPEVAILGVVRSKMAPVWNGKEFVPRLMLPLCLSYD
ncbi:MAG: 2-oxo acid dehydrogenase subunit E2, partial [Beijerinckiaceae bacterium]